MGILSWFTRKGNGNGSKQEEPTPAPKSDAKTVSEAPGMNGAVEVRKPDQLLADISVFEFGSVAASTDKTAAELAGRQENFTKELDFVFADLSMAIIADFMLVWLPAPTVSLRPPLSVNAGCLNKFFYACPDNAFQVAFAGMSYSLLQRIGAVMRNGGKLFVVGTGASLIGTGLTVLLIAARIAIDASFDGKTNDLPILSTSVAYGIFMAVSSNLRYQILAGVIEQRILEPLFHENKLILGATCFAIRTGNTFLGSLMWVAYAHWIGIQTINE